MSSEVSDQAPRFMLIRLSGAMAAVCQVLEDPASPKIQRLDLMLTLEQLIEACDDLHTWLLERDQA